VRPSLVTTGASPRYAAIGPASSVADITTTCKSGRTVRRTNRTIASAKSASSPRS
jgi:hypothetical protein